MYDAAGEEMMICSCGMDRRVRIFDFNWIWWLLKGLVGTLYQLVEDLKITLIGGDDVIYAFGDTPLI